MTADQYTRLLLKLLPSGKAWRHEPGTTLYKTAQAIADELARIDGRGMDLIEEADPRTTDELLEQWESVLGLPNECTGSTATTPDERRHLVLQKLIAQAGQSRQFLIDLAATLGFTITIEEFKEFVAGSDAGGFLTNTTWPFAFKVHSTLKEKITYFEAGSGKAGDPLASWENEVLECIISHAKPAHTYVLFAYDE